MSPPLSQGRDCGKHAPRAVCWSSGFSLGRLTVPGADCYSHTVAIDHLCQQERRLKPELQRAANGTRDQPVGRCPPATLTDPSRDAPPFARGGQGWGRVTWFAGYTFAARQGDTERGKRGETSQRTQQRQLLVVFPRLLLKQPQPRTHHFARIAVRPVPELIVDEPVAAIRQVDISRRHPPPSFPRSAIPHSAFRIRSLPPAHGDDCSSRRCPPVGLCDPPPSIFHLRRRSLLKIETFRLK